MTRKRSPWCNIIGVALGLAVVAPPVTMLLDRREPITILPGRVDPYYVREGSLVVVTWPLIENRSCAGEIRRVVRDSSGKIHEFAFEPTIYHRLMSGDMRTFSKNMTMPHGMAPGLAFYYGIGVRWCNVFQQFLWPIPFVSPEIPICVLPGQGMADAPCVVSEP